MTTFSDPSSVWRQEQTGLTQRQLVLKARKEGWTTRKIYGRTWIASDDLNEYAEQVQADSQPYTFRVAGRTLIVQSCWDDDDGTLHANIGIMWRDPVNWEHTRWQYSPVDHLNGEITYGHEQRPESFEPMPWAEWKEFIEENWEPIEAFIRQMLDYNPREAAQ